MLGTTSVKVRVHYETLFTPIIIRVVLQNINQKGGVIGVYRGRIAEHMPAFDGRPSSQDDFDFLEGSDAEDGAQFRLLPNGTSITVNGAELLSRRKTVFVSELEIEVQILLLT